MICLEKWFLYLIQQESQEYEKIPSCHLICLIEDLPELNGSEIPGLVGNYLSDIIKSVMTSALSGKE